MTHAGHTHDDHAGHAHGPRGHVHAPANFGTAFAIGIGLNTAFVMSKRCLVTSAIRWHLLPMPVIIFPTC